MDYEKKYKEALERVRRLHDRMLVLSSTDALVASSELEFIFPELRESEDERIRKWLIEAVHLIGVDKDICADQETMDKAIAWLEKQKKPENTSASTMVPSCWAEEPSLQKEQEPEWSDEDEEMLSKIIKHFDWYDSDRFNAEDCKEAQDFLKSLRPSWKPSEEQMKALEAATVRYQSTGLESLFEELKKL